MSGAGTGRRSRRAAAERRATAGRAAAPRSARLRHRRRLVPRHGRQRAARRVGRRAGGDHPLPAHGVRGAGARRGVPAAPDARRLAPSGRRLAARPHGGDVVAHAAAVLLRGAPHQRRHRHVHALPHAGVGGARGAPALQVAARADRVAGARPRPRRPGRHPRPRPPRRGRRGLAARHAGRAVHRLRLRHLHDLGEGADQDRRSVDHLDGGSGRRHAARAPAGALAVQQHRLPPGRQGVDRRGGHGRVLHGDPVHALDRRHQARARGARDHPRLHRAGRRTAVRGVPRRPAARRSGR